MGPLNRLAAVIGAHRDRVIDGVVVVGCAVATATPATQSGIFTYVDWQPPLWFSIAVVVLVGASAWWRRWPAQFVFGALAGWVALSAYVAVLVAQYTVAERSRSWRITSASTLLTVVVVGLPIWLPGGADAAAPLSVVVCVAPALLGLYVGTRRELITRMRERAE